MKLLRLMVVCCCALLLLPAPAQAAPRQQNLGCTFAQIPIIGSLSGLTITQQKVAIDGVELRLKICAPLSDSYTAAQMLNRLAGALPLLSAHAGVPLYGSQERLIVMVDKTQLLPFVDGQMVEGENVIELHRRSQDWTVVHEGAHYWANHENFREPWMVEGYAEYLTERAMIDMGSPLRMERPDPLCSDTPLRAWQNTGLNSCGYTAGAAVFRDLASAVGEDQFKQTLGALASAGGVTSEGMLAALEQASGKDLLDAMRPVFPAEEFEARKQARALMRRLVQANQRGAPLGIEPPATIVEAIERGDFESAQGWLDQLDTLFPAAEALAGRCGELGLACARIWGELPADPGAVPGLVQRLASERAMLDQLASLRQRARAARLDAPAAVAQAAQAFEPGAAERIRQALAGLDLGLGLEQRCGQLQAPCSDSWRKLWSAAAFEGVTAVVSDTAGVLALAEDVEKGCQGFVETCRQLWHGALAQEQLVEATQALQALDRALDGEERMRGMCGDVGDACRRFWAGALQSGGFEAASGAVATIDDMLARGKAIEGRCTDDWPCRQSWQAAFRQTGDPQAARRRMDEIAAKLPRLQAAAEVVKGSGARDAARAPDSPIREAQRALADGQVGQAAALAEEIIAAEERRQRIASTLPIAGVVGLSAVLLLLVLLLVRGGARRPRPPSGRLPAPPDDGDLLAALLAQPPQGGASHGQGS